MFCSYTHDGPTWIDRRQLPRVAMGETCAANSSRMGGRYRNEGRVKLPLAVCDCCACFMWMRFQIGIFCSACKNGWYIHSVNFIFYECPSCLGASLGCGCVRGLVAVPREQTTTGAWVTFSQRDERGCVEITNLTHNEPQAISDSYSW
jgi:hypothetical protein